MKTVINIEINNLADDIQLKGKQRKLFINEINSKLDEKIYDDVMFSKPNKANTFYSIANKVMIKYNK